MSDRSFTFPATPTNKVVERFGYHPPNNDHIRDGHEAVREECGVLAAFLNENLPEGREKSTALTKLQEVMFWANAAIALEQEFAGETE